MKLFIGGSREDFDEDKAYEIMFSYITECIIKNKSVEIIHGAARGIDAMADNIAIQKNLRIKTFVPEWDKYGKTAGPIRNQEMVEYCDCGLLIWNGKSPGTKGTLSMLIASGKPFILHRL